MTFEEFFQQYSYKPKQKPADSPEAKAMQEWLKGKIKLTLEQIPVGQTFTVIPFEEEEK